MFENLNLGDVSRALQISRGDQGFQMPAGTEEALRRTGSTYVPTTTAQRAPQPVPQPAPSPVAAAPQQPPSWVGAAQRGVGLLGSGERARPGLMNSPMAGARPQGDVDGDGVSRPGLANSPLAGAAKKVVSAVAAYYTGGLSSLAMNVGGQVLSEKNPKAGALAGAAGSFF